MMSRLVAYVGTYAGPESSGGIVGLTVSRDGQSLKTFTHAAEPKFAGYLSYAPRTRTLYAVDERKTDGRGPVDKPAAVHALSVDQVSGGLTHLNCQLALGPRPTFLDYSEGMRLLVSANHGDFQHVEKVVKDTEGHWKVDYVYDDSTVVVYPLLDDGGLKPASDVHVFAGHGIDPNRSPQNGGHAQSSPHAHCAVIDPSGQFVLVCDKGTDRIDVFRLGARLTPVSSLQFRAEAGPRHLAFDLRSGLAFVTLEFSSELASLRFDPRSGALTPLSSISTLSPAYRGKNEPAEVRVHPDGNLVYVNNRGEDSLVGFGVDLTGSLRRLGAVSLAPSLHPGVAARSFTLDASGTFMLVADRPAHSVLSFSINRDTGTLTKVAQAGVRDPAHIVLVELEGPAEAAGAT